MDDSLLRSSGRIFVPFSSEPHSSDSQPGERFMLTQKESDRFWSNVQFTDGCWIWTGNRDRCGYGVFYRHGKRPKTHRLAFEEFYGPVTGELRVCHSCDNPPCVNPEHFFIGTQADNIGDMCSKERQPRGITHGMAKLTEHEVLTIREMHRNGQRTTPIAVQFGVCNEHVRNIILRKLWRHI